MTDLTPADGYTLVVGPPGPDRDWLEQALHTAGFEIAAWTEADVLAAADLVPPRLVLLDDAVVGNGAARLDSFGRLRKHPPLVGIPVAILSYDADIDSFSSAISHGVAAYLVKPANWEELLGVAQKLSGWSGRTDRTEKRRRLRRPLILKVEVDLRARKLRVPGQILDVSSTGCRLELGEEVAAGDLLRVILQAHDASTHVALGAEVKWHRLTPSGIHLVGARFTGTTAMLAGKILGFVSSGMT